MNVKKTPTGRVSFTQVDMVEREWLRCAVQESIESGYHANQVKTVGEAVHKLYCIGLAELFMFLRRHCDSRSFTMAKSMAMTLMICLGRYENHTGMLLIRNDLHKLLS